MLLLHNLAQIILITPYAEPSTSKHFMYIIVAVSQ